MQIPLCFTNPRAVTAQRCLPVWIVAALLSILCALVSTVQAQGLAPAALQALSSQDREPPRKGRYSTSSGSEGVQQRLDINLATASQLEERLPGIGPAKASRIVEWRSLNGAFQTLDQLLKVNGIGPKTLERIRPYLRVGEAAALNNNSSGDPVEEQVALAVQHIVAVAQRDAVAARREAKAATRSSGD